MLQGWVVVVVALGTIGLLFVVASYGDRVRMLGRDGRSRLLIYPLSLAIYCTSWTFFGSVGLASRTTYDFLTIYVGPILMVGLASPLIIRIVRLAKAQNITSIADFIAARYGKSQAVAATVALIAIVGTIPYIALQLKAVSASLGTILTPVATAADVAPPVFGDIALFVALSMAAFAVLFGTRHIDATEHQDGLMLAIAAESLIKLAAFLAVGMFVTFWMFDGPVALFTQAMENEQTAAALTRQPQGSTLIAMTVLSFVAILLLPRQFHVTVVENHSESEIKRAAWLFPLYLVLINLFVVPIALAGMLTFPGGGVDSDMFVLALPLQANSELFTLLAFIGGLSAATAMVIVETVALSIMVSNDLIVPWVLKRREALLTGRGDVGALLLLVRRGAIVAVLLLAYVYYRSAGGAQLASIGLLAFAAMAQLAPAFFGGLYWRRATAHGAIAGMSAGIVTWAYMLLLPSLADSGIVGPAILTDGLFGLHMLRPQAMLGVELPPLAHGVLWSLTLNVAAYIGFSLRRAPSVIEQMQAELFMPMNLAPKTPSFRLWRSSVTVEQLTDAVGRYLGEERTRLAFESFAGPRRISLEPQADSDLQLLRHAEFLLASAIGAASSRLVLSLLLRKRTVSPKAALKLLDDANAAIHYNREILQTALDHVQEGIAVFDKDLHLICWNRQFGDILDLPAHMTRIGVHLGEILRISAERSGIAPGAIDARLLEQIDRTITGSQPILQRFAERGTVAEIRSNRMPDGGIVTTVTDITASVNAAEALARANATLELRVEERTTELTRLNAELGRAKGDAEDANVSKTRFLAAAGHDIMQPLNAARLYVTALIERQDSGERPIEKAGDDRGLMDNVDASLEAVEDIISALLDISRLDSGTMRTELTSFRIADLMRQLDVEFAPSARAKGLDLIFVPCSLVVRSDRRLLRRLLQNLVSNAVKYTPRGRVLIGCRRSGDGLRIDVLDTGIGIPASKRRAVFEEFQRLDEGARVARGLGLGLSIVERIARVLEHPIELRSRVRHGSRFSVQVPLSDEPAEIRQPRHAIDVDRGPMLGANVLCIDNEASILEGMALLLGGWGCRVFTASHIAAGEKALAEAGAEPHGLLVDYHLDRGDGIAAVGALRARYGAGLPAILITADRSPRVRDLAREHGIHVLNKPIKPAALRALMAQWRMRPAAAAE